MWQCGNVAQPAKPTTSKMEEEQHEHHDEPLGIADAMMRRGDHLRMLRMMAEQDDAERAAAHSNVSSSGTSDGTPASLDQDDEYETLPTSGRSKLLHYDSYLRHQRYHDDLKHVDYHYINYGGCDGGQRAGGRLVIRQQKGLGKGGICWDAAFILAEHMIACEKDWKMGGRNNDSGSNSRRTTLCELGAGTGLAGFMVAKACRDSHVFVTDLPELLDLMKTNFELNFVNSKRVGSSDAGLGEDLSFLRQMFRDDLFRSEGTAEAKVLRWGVKSDYEGAPFDVVFGADVVASLYDPIALANTFSDLCGPKSLVYLSYKGRLDEPHLLFEAELKRLFRVVERIVHSSIHSRNKNSDVCILKAWGKIE